MNINYDINPDTLLIGKHFHDKRVVVFGLPGAFTPTCSTKQLPGYEEHYSIILDKGIDEVYCTSVNDRFIMDAWFKEQGIENVKILDDGTGQFARRMGMLVTKDNLGFGLRSWRYAAVINNGVIEVFLPEDGICDECAIDPYEQSTPENLLTQL